MRKNTKIWILVEKDLTGTKKQALALSHNFKADIVEIDFTMRWPWSWLAPYFNILIQHAIKPQLNAPWPDMIIAAGRKAVAPALWAKKQSRGKTYVHFIQDPKYPLTTFDSVSAPLHDQINGPNVYRTIAALSSITKKNVTAAKKEFPKLEKLKKPRVAVLIGGNSKTHKMRFDTIDSLKAIDASLMITASRRTPDRYKEQLKKIGAKKNNVFWNGKGKNPYMAYLGYADYILVTSDSVSMISDAIATGKPVYLLKMNGQSPKFQRLYSTLVEGAYVRWYDGKLENWGTKPLNESANLAEWLKERYLRHVTKLGNKTDI